MTDLERKFLYLVHKLTGHAYLAMIATLMAMAGADKLEPLEGYSRGDFKRAIRSLRENAVAAPQFSEDYNKAVILIRRDWLHREGAQE